MRRLKTILTLAMLYIICSAKSCGDGNADSNTQEEKLVVATMDSLKHTMEVNSPDEQHLSNLESVAILKVQDFADYLKVAADTAQETAFRKQAAAMTLKLFADKNSDLKAWSQLYTEKRAETLDQLLTQCNQKGNTCWIRPFDFSIKQSLIRKNDSTFTGIITFSAQCISYANPQQMTGSPAKIDMEILAIRHNKHFGKNQMKVWEAFLGNTK